MKLLLTLVLILLATGLGAELANVYGQGKGLTCDQAVGVYKEMVADRDLVIELQARQIAALNAEIAKEKK